MFHFDASVFDSERNSCNFNQIITMFSFKGMMMFWFKLQIIWNSRKKKNCIVMIGATCKWHWCHSYKMGSNVPKQSQWNCVFSILFISLNVIWVWQLQFPSSIDPSELVYWVFVMNCVMPPERIPYCPRIFGICGKNASLIVRLWRFQLNF